MSERTMTTKAAMAFMNDMAVYFENKSAGGDDAAYWAKVYNAENCRIIANMIHRIDRAIFVLHPPHNPEKEE